LIGEHVLPDEFELQAFLIKEAAFLGKTIIPLGRWWGYPPQVIMGSWRGEAAVQA
jgi:hypothetical protein